VSGAKDATRHGAPGAGETHGWFSSSANNLKLAHWYLLPI